MKKLSPFLILSTVLFASPFEETLKGEREWLEEEVFVISASKVKDDIKKSTASIHVIDEEFIKNSAAGNIFDLLRTIPGINISQSNVYLERVEVRGVKTLFSDKVLILLDGHSLNADIRLGGGVSGYKNIPLSIIKRVEIIKGPASALYGENAFSALVNIITKKADEINGSEVYLKAGDNDTKEVSVLYGNKHGDLDITANISYKTTDGEKQYIPKDAIGNSGYTNPYTKSSFGYLNLFSKKGIYFKGNYNVIEDGPRYGFNNNINDEDYSKRSTFGLELGFEKDIRNDLYLNSKVYFDRHKAKNEWEQFPEGFPAPLYTDGIKSATGFKSQKLGFESLLSLKRDNYKIISGISAEKQKVKDTWAKANYDPLTFAPLGYTKYLNATELKTYNMAGVKRDFWALYSELLYDPRKDIRITAGARYDKFDDFGSVTNPRVGVAWQINRDNNLKFMYGEAFRSPPGVNNIDVDPEKVKSLELSLQNNALTDLNTRITLFQSKIDDIIILDPTGTYKNQGETKTTGVEFEFKYNLSRGSFFSGNYTYQDPKDDIIDKTIQDISNHMGYLALNYRMNRYFNLYMDTNYLGSQNRLLGDTRAKVKSSLISNISVLGKGIIKKDIDMSFKISNVFNKGTYDSALPFDYPVKGRNFTLGVTYSF